MKLPTAEEIAIAVNEACHRLGESPADLWDGVPGLNARHYAAFALYEEFPDIKRSDLPGMVGATPKNTGFWSNCLAKSRHPKWRPELVRIIVRAIQERRTVAEPVDGADATGPRPPAAPLTTSATPLPVTGGDGLAHSCPVVRDAPAGSEVAAGEDTATGAPEAGQAEAFTGERGGEADENHGAAESSPETPFLFDVPAEQELRKALRSALADWPPADVSAELARIQAEPPSVYQKALRQALPPRQPPGPEDYGGRRRASRVVVDVTAEHCGDPSPERSALADWRRRQSAVVQPAEQGGIMPIGIAGGLFVPDDDAEPEDEAE